MKLMFKAGKLYEFVQEEVFYYFCYIGKEMAFYGYWRKGSDIDSRVSKNQISSWLDYQENSNNNIIERDIKDYPQVSEIQKAMIKKLFMGWLI